MLTGYLATLPTDTLLSAGVLYCSKAGVYGPVGVTDGAPDFDPGVELGEIMFDNRAPSRLKGLTRRVGFQPVIKGTLKEFGPVASGSQIALLEPGVSEATVSGTTTETVKAAGALYAAGDYIVDFRWIFERAGGGYACIYAPLAIVRKWSAKGNDKKEASITFEIEAVGDPVNDLGTGPYAIEIRTSIAIHPLDGSDADVIATIGTSHILSFWNPEVNLTLGGGGTSGGVAQLDDVRGVGAGPSLFGVNDAFGTFWLPNYDAGTKSIRTNTGGPTVLVTPWAGSSQYNLSQTRTLVWFGRPRTVSAGTNCCGIQNAATPTTIRAVFRGDNGAGAAQGIIAATDNAGDAHSWSDDAAAPSPFGAPTIFANAEAAPRGMVLTLPQPTGANHSLQATPQATVEKLGRLRRMLIQASPNDNVFTPFPSANGRVFFGGQPFGTNSVNTADIEFYGGLVIDKVLTRTEIAALERWAVRRGCSIDTSVSHGIACIGDSRMYGNGASDSAHTAPGVLRTLFTSGYDVDNRGVSGDQFVNATSSNTINQRFGGDQDSHRSWDWAVIWIGVNAFNDTTTYPPSGITAAAALVQLDILIAAAKADGKKVCVCHETGQVGGLPQAAAYNTGIDARLTSHAIDAVAAIETGADVMDFTDVADYTDGLHPTSSTYAEIAQIIHDAIVAAGG